MLAFFNIEVCLKLGIAHFLNLLPSDVETGLNCELSKHCDEISSIFLGSQRVLCQPAGRLGHQGLRISHESIQIQRTPEESAFNELVGIVVKVHIGSSPFVVDQPQAGSFVRFGIDCVEGVAGRAEFGIDHCAAFDFSIDWHFVCSSVIFGVDDLVDVPLEGQCFFSG